VVSISFSLYGYEYVSGIAVIEKAYAVSQRALHEQKYAVYAQLEAIRRGELEDCYDPDSGEPSLSNELDYELGQIESARQNLCQAVLVMLYHFWEKQVLSWAGKLKGKDLHKSYVEYCRKVGLQLDVDRLEQLRCLTNLVKHGQGNSEWGNKLYDLNPLLFPKSSKSKSPLDYLDLSDAYVAQTFEALRNSGPDILSDFNPSNANSKTPLGRPIS
jgi:hypothetical protein